MAKNIYEDASLGGAIGTVYGDVRDSAKQWDKLLFDPYRHRLTDAAEAAPQAIANYVVGKAKEGRRQINAFREAAGYAPLPERAPTAKATPPTPAPQAVAPAPAPQAVAPAPAAPSRGGDIVDYLNQSTGGFSNAGFEPEARGPDLDDLNTLRAELSAIGERTGRGPNLITQRAIDNLASKRWESYNRARGNDVTEKVGLAGVAQRNRATDIQQQNADLQARLRNLPDKEKMVATQLMAVMADTGTLPGVKKDAQLQFQALMSGITDADIDEALLAKDIMSEGVQMKAEGGEIEPMGMELPGVIDEAPIDMNSGDYVIPVEALRFYGRKFFQDLINKAEDAVE